MEMFKAAAFLDEYSIEERVNKWTFKELDMKEKRK